MWVKIGLLFGLVSMALSATGALVFLARILLWTFGLWDDPIPSLIRLAVWCVTFLLFFLFSRWLNRTQEVTE